MDSESGTSMVAKVLTEGRGEGGEIVIKYAVAEVAKENSQYSEKNMTEAEADALKMLSKLTEAAETPMRTEMRVRVLKTIEGSLKTAEEAYKKFDMLLEELKLMEFGS